MMKTRSNSVIAYHFCRYDHNQQRDPKKMLLSLAYQMTTRIEEYKDKLISLIKDKNLKKETFIGEGYNLMDTFDTLLKGPLCSIKEPGQFVIVIDALDECYHSGRNNRLDCIQQYFGDLPPWLRFFVTTRPEYPIMAKLKKFEPELIEPESGDNLNDLHLFFENLLTKQHITSKVSINKLVKQSEGLFVYARILAEMIEEGSEIITKKTLDDLPMGIDEYYEQQFSRIFDNNSSTEKWYERIEWKIIGFVVVAKEPLHEEFLQKLTGVPKKDEFDEAIQKLSLFFPQHNDKRVHTYHKSLADWLTIDDNYTDFSIDLYEQEKILAEKCWNVLNDCKIPGSTAADQIDLEEKHDPVVIKHIMQHGVTHLCSAGMKIEARKLVLDVGWLITATVTLENRHNLVLDYERLQENDRIVELVGSAVSLAMNDDVMREDHRQLLEFLIGRLGGGRSTKGAISSTDNNKDSLNKLSAYVQTLRDYRCRDHFIP